MKQPDLTLTKEQLRTLQRGSVYAMKRGETYLYIGASGEGIKRVLHHNIVDKIIPMQDGDLIEFWWFDDWFAAAAFESEMNKIHSPKYSKHVDSLENRECPVCDNVFTPSRKWQRFCVNCKNTRTFKPLPKK